MLGTVAQRRSPRRPANDRSGVLPPSIPETNGEVERVKSYNMPNNIPKVLFLNLMMVNINAKFSVVKQNSKLQPDLNESKFF